MARVEYLTAEQLDEQHRHLLARPINLSRAVAHSPAGLQQFQRYAQWIRFECEVDPRLRELAILRVGYLAGSEYEYSHHVEIGRHFGVTDDDIRAIGGPDGTARDPAAGVVLQAATEITQDCRLADPTWQSLVELLGLRAAVELVLVVAHYSAVVRVIGALEVDVEERYRGYLDEFPLP